MLECSGHPPIEAPGHTANVLILHAHAVGPGATNAALGCTETHAVIDENHQKASAHKPLQTCTQT